MRSCAPSLGGGGLSCGRLKRANRYQICTRREAVFVQSDQTAADRESIARLDIQPGQGGVRVQKKKARGQCSMVWACKKEVVLVAGDERRE